MQKLALTLSVINILFFFNYALETNLSTQQLDSQAAQACVKIHFPACPGFQNRADKVNWRSASKYKMAVFFHLHYLLKNSYRSFISTEVLLK